MSGKGQVVVSDKVRAYFARNGADAAVAIWSLLESYVERKLEREAEEKRAEREHEDAERRAEAMRARGIEGATAIGGMVMVPRSDMEAGQCIMSPADFGYSDEY